MNRDLPYIQSTENNNNNSYYTQKVAALAYLPTQRGQMAATIGKTERIAPRISINKSYLFNIKNGISRIVLIVLLTGGWISAAAVAKNLSMIDAYPALASTRTAYLFFSLFAFFVSLIYFLLNLFNIINLEIFRSIPWFLIIFVFDCLFLITLFCVSIAAAARESQLASYDPQVYSVVSKGAFASAAAFGFMSVIVLMGLVGLAVYGLVQSRKSNSTDATNGSANPNTSGSAMPRSVSQGVYPGNDRDKDRDRTENI